MKPYVFHKDRYFKEFKEIFNIYPTNVDHLYSVLDELNAQNPNASSYRRKGFVYEVAAENCKIHLMPSCPFYFELDTGREQNSVTSTFNHEPGLPNYMLGNSNELRADYETLTAPLMGTLLHGGMFADLAHHYADIERVLAYGFAGLYEQAEVQKQALRERGDARGVDFLECVQTGLRAVMRVADRMADEAERRLETETDSLAKDNYTRIANTARRIPKEPAETFYEALEVAIYVRELCNALEGVGFAVFGHLDRILYPYYKADLDAGRITEEEAQALIDAFCAMTDARWNLEIPLPGGTNATVVIGGCDRDGTIVYNAVSKMFIASFMEHRFANPKLQARFTQDHPMEYFELVGELAGMGTNVLSIFNDPVLIEAQVKQGKKPEDSRMYLAGGCQEPFLQNELNSRAYAYVSMPTMLDASLFPEDWEKKLTIYELNLMPAYKAKTFDEFYCGFLYNYNVQVQYLANLYNRFGRQWVKANPMPMYSGIMEGCIEKALDVTEGGATYNSDSLSMTGIGTMIDALLAIKTAVYEEQTVSMDELRLALAANFEGYEPLRQYLLNRMPKMGQGDEAVAEFTAKVFSDVATLPNVLPNYRGGYFESSFFSFYAFEWLNASPASAGGRRQGDTLSRGINPSESTQGIDAAALLYAQEKTDFTLHAGGGVLYMDLPIVKGKEQKGVYASIIQLFLQNGGSIMDFNVVSRKQLIEAQKDPGSHRSIVVRVCGYSALFHSLEQKMQDEIIGRTQR